MSMSEEALVIMYSSSKMFIQERIRVGEELGHNCDDRKRELQIVEKAWDDYLKSFSK